MLAFEHFCIAIFRVHLGQVGCEIPFKKPAQIARLPYGLLQLHHSCFECLWEISSGSLHVSSTDQHYQSALIVYFCALWSCFFFYLLLCLPVYLQSLYGEWLGSRCLCAIGLADIFHVAQPLVYKPAGWLYSDGTVGPGCL